MSAPRTLEEKQAEKDRLAKAYRAYQRERWAELCEQEPRFPAIKKALRQIREPSALLLRLADSWVRRAPMEHRRAILRLIDQHANRECRFAGRPILDDPVPPGRNVFLVAREMLAVR